jgi:hypothetical protein
MKLDYKSIVEKELKGDKKWWRPFVWGVCTPVKVKIMGWLALENKMLIWDNRLKRGWS